MGVGAHQSCVLSPLPFILVLVALSREFRIGVPWEVHTQEECIYKLKVWKAGVESKRFRAHMKKTKFVISSVGHDVPITTPSSAHSASCGTRGTMASQSRSVVTSAENPAPENSPQSIGELRNGHVANLQELIYQTGSKNGVI